MSWKAIKTFHTKQQPQEEMHCYLKGEINAIGNQDDRDIRDRTDRW